MATDTISVGGPTLREYQTKGVEWMDSLYISDSSGILADEMGLGKTIQVLSFLEKLHHRHRISGPHLIVMPLSVISSWKGDLKRFNRVAFDVHIHHGERQQREDAFDYWARQLKRCMHKTPWLLRISIVITTYEVALKDEQLLRSLSRGSCKWQYLVVDEAHRLKNRYSLLFEALNRIHHSGHRLLLTGTPLQNNLSELWSLLHFILPDVFTNEQEFRDLFNQHFECDSDVEAEHSYADTEHHKSRRDINQQRRQSKLFSLITMAQCKNNTGLAEEVEKKSIVAQLHELIKPHILRRVKSDVALELPPKVEKIVYCPLSALQRDAYELFRTRVRSSTTHTHKTGSGSHLADADDVFGPYEKALMNVNNLLMQLRKLCNHPYLVLEDVKTIPDALYYQHLIRSSGKLFVLDKLLTPLLQQGSKVLIFSQMTSMLDILQGYLQQRGISCARLDGNTPQLSREQQLRVFNRSTVPGSGAHRYNCSPVSHADGNSTVLDVNTPTEIAEIESEYSVFLLSTRAGGVGINLQAADTVILFDSDWNPQQDLQAISRAHRIGQTRPVLVLRLVSTGPDEHTYSVEQRILRRAGKKLDAERQVLANGVFDLSETALTEHSAEVVEVKTSSAPDRGANVQQGVKNANTNMSVRDAEESPVHAKTGAESLQESMLSLFETITDSESVSTDSGSPRGTPIVSTFMHNTSQSTSIRRSTGTHTQKTSADAVFKKVIDVYKFDFTDAGIADMCRREDTASTRDNTAAYRSSNIDKELVTLMREYDKKVWRSWLHPESVDNSSPDSVSKRGRNAPKSVSNKYAQLDVEVRSGRRNLREQTLNSSDKEIHEERYSDSEQPIYQFGRKRKALDRSPARSNRKSPRGQNRNTGESSADGTAYEDSDDPYAVLPTGARSPSPVLLQEDDICALCNQAWVTPAEVQAFLDLKLQSLLHRAAPMGSPAALPSPYPTMHSVSNTPFSVTSTAKSVASVTLSSGDIGAEKSAATINSSSKKWTGASRGVGRGQSTDALLTLMDAKSPEPVISRNSKLSPPRSAASNAPNVNDMLNMMILCDGCDGSYHMVCVGLEEVPQNDWYCQPCRFSLT